MLKKRILSTLIFFDLQDYPLTLLELQRFLIADWESIQQQTDRQGELAEIKTDVSKPVSLMEILSCLDNECQGLVEQHLGFYYLPGKRELVERRLRNYLYGLKREKLISRYAWILRHVPFVRSAGLGGSQAMGLQKPGSDIDLFIVTDPQYMWLARTSVTVVFQFLGKRRHGQNIANRFCLNHYVAGPKALRQIRTLYSAMEYGRLRPLVYGQHLLVYQQNNQSWINVFFPNWQPVPAGFESQSYLQKVLEKLLHNGLGRTLERLFKAWQLPKIKKSKFIIVEDDELSFHPDSKQENLLDGFFKFQEQQQRMPVEPVGQVEIRAV